MHFSDPNHREALDALNRIKLREKVGEELAQSRELRRTAEAMAREAEHLKEMAERLSRPSDPTHGSR